MKTSSASSIAREIIQTNKYLTLSTADGGSPWVAPVFYCTDDKFNFYFISQLGSRHIQHVLQNPHVAFAIFDSQAPEGQGTGVQALGTVQMLETKVEIQSGLEYYNTSFVECTIEEFMGENTYRLFKLIPETVYINDPEAEVDQRIDVTL